MDSPSTRGIWWNLDDISRNSIHWMRFWPGDRLITVTTTAGPPRMIASWMRAGHQAVLEGVWGAPDAEGWSSASIQTAQGSARPFRFRVDGAEVIGEESGSVRAGARRYTFVALDDAVLDTPPPVRVFKTVTTRSLLKAGLARELAENGPVSKKFIKSLSYLTLPQIAQQIDPDLAKRIASWRDAFPY